MRLQLCEDFLKGKEEARLEKAVLSLLLEMVVYTPNCHLKMRHCTTLEETSCILVFQRRNTRVER